jgi:hypothetical protein
MARSEGGKEAAEAMEELLGMRRRGSSSDGGELAIEERRKRVARIVDAHPDWSNQRVADEIGCAKEAVRGDRIELGLPMPKSGPRPKPPISDEQRAEVERELRETVDSDTTIAERVGVSVTEVSVLRKALGIPPSPTRRARATKKAVAAVLAAHPSWIDRRVAEEVGTTVPVVRHHRKALVGNTEPPKKQSRETLRNARLARVAAYIKEHPRAGPKEVATALGEPFGTIRHDCFHLRRADDAATEDSVSAASEIGSESRLQSRKSPS